ncbi:MAG TPA: hypothetical protein VMT35_12110 [Ignavibacteriaceae bacterium]|nr:hypothetical protein [Ignavibacteriaceae bacterium]
MFQNLENYLDEINHYLAVSSDAKEILAEIKSHILEKTEAEYKTITEDTVNKIIAGYGKPQQVAAKYLEGFEIISPTFKRHLFLYTGILFACHFGLTLVAFLFQFSMVGFPFLYIPDMNIWQFIFYVPMAFIYDIGLVAIFLYLMTQKKKEIRMPWPRLFAKEMKKPKIIFMILLILTFVFFLFTFLKFGTIFFASMNDPSNPTPMFDRSASLYYSLLFLALIACEVIGYALRFVNRSRWLNLIKNFVILILLQFVWNSPVKAEFVKIPGIDLKNNAIALVLIITIVVAFKFLRSLISVGIQQFTLKK